MIFPCTHKGIKIVLSVPLYTGLLSRPIGIRLGQQAGRVRNKNQGAEQATRQSTLPRFHRHPPFEVFLEPSLAPIAACLTKTPVGRTT